LVIYSFLESYIGYKRRTLGNGDGIEGDASGKTLGIYLEHGERIGNIKFQKSPIPQPFP